MLVIVFKNMPRSDLMCQAVREKLNPIIEKFPKLEGSQLRLTLELENAPLHSGPDQFTVRLGIENGPYRDIRITKTAPQFYLALAELAERMLERLNRYGDRRRVQNRTRQRMLREPRLKALRSSSERPKDPDFYDDFDYIALPH